MSDEPKEPFERYDFAALFVGDLLVLDLGSGEGEGAEHLAHSATFVAAFENDAELVERARQRYVRENLHFQVGNYERLALATASVDVVTSLQSLRSLDEAGPILREIKRVLKPDGTLILSSPDGLDKLRVFLEASFRYVVTLHQPVPYRSSLHFVALASDFMRPIWPRSGRRSSRSRATPNQTSS